MDMDIDTYVLQAFIASIVASPEKPGLTSEELIGLGIEDGYGRGEINDEINTIHTHYEEDRIFSVGTHEDFIGSVDIDFVPEFRNLAAMDRIHTYFFEQRRELGINNLGATRRALKSDGKSHGINECDMDVAITCMLVGNVLSEHNDIIKPKYPLRELYSSKKNRSCRMDFRAEKVKALADRIRDQRRIVYRHASSDGIDSSLQSAIETEKSSGNFTAKLTVKGIEFIESGGFGRSNQTNEIYSTSGERKPSMEKPRIFIGSSTEGLDVAKYIQLELEHKAECTVWSQGNFGLSGGTLESLIQVSKHMQFAVLVLTPDDLVHKRETIKRGPRDNVLFELGFFMGALGRERTFIVYCRDEQEKMDLPTDLAGITAATFAKHSDGNLQAAVGSACTKIWRAIGASNQYNKDS